MSTSIQPFAVRGVLTLLVLACCSACSRPPATIDGHAAQQAAGGRHALLVGCGQYELGEAWRLYGPENDVALFGELLRRQFGFADRDIVKLVAAGGPRRRPTRENIEREFAALGERARPGDQVVILLAGHGSQQPDQQPPLADDPEPDGKDEVFLPVDAGKPVAGQSNIPRGIVDDELHLWLKRIAARGAEVLIVFDACHSGTAMRGASDERMREIPVEAIFSASAVAEMVEREEQQGVGRGVARPSGWEVDAQLPNVVALYAAQAHETEPERPLPPGGDDHGLLTFTLCEVLTQEPGVRYRDLPQRIFDAYTRTGKPRPTPFVEGKDLDRSVLGIERRRAPIELSQSADGHARVNVGRLNGLTENCVLAVFASEADPARDAPLAHAKIESCGVTESIVTPVAQNGAPTPTALPKQGRCAVIALDYGDLKVAIFVNREGQPGQNSLAAALDALATELALLASRPGALHRIALQLSDATWVLQARGGRLELLPATAALVKDDTDLPVGITPLPLVDSDPTKEVVGYLQQIYRAQNLLRLASWRAEELVKSDAASSDGCQARLEMLQFASKADAEGKFLDWQNGPPALRSGDLVCWRVTNTGTSALDITLLFVDSQWTITPVFPRPVALDRANRLRPGEHYQTAAATINAKTLGDEHIVLIAVGASGAQPVDFTALAEQSFQLAQEKEQATRGAGPRPLDSPLGRLLRYSSYGFQEGVRRGQDAADIQQSALRAVSWRVLRD